ncbi:molybdenum cofactor guanylyltransferase [Salsuginibacillus kocurii]|uniref:molybdenum cofactor guanylyltransferase n=1 Tax=Salsuginibacillus kocurii TaxID=427078 RepID=UPI0003657AA2|nr:molybdenum cofactor guanylyltransferase [Salsuginibacillus kocurii]
MKAIGIVLAGGKSSRYGKDKMFETYQAEPLYQKSIRALTENDIQSVYLSTNDKLAPFFEFPDEFILTEDDEYLGPLPALYQALLQINGEWEWLFLLASDLPYISPAFVAKLKAAAAHSSSQVIVPVADDQIQPLHSCYHKSCFPIIEELVHNKIGGMRPLFNEAATDYLPFDETWKDFHNINRPADWDKN